jgi:hypothetical protein
MLTFLSFVAGHVTLYFCGRMWHTVSDAKRAEVFSLLSSFNGTSFTVHSIRRSPNCFYFASEELLAIRTRLLATLNVPWEKGHDKTIEEFHCKIVDSEESRGMFTEGNSFQFTFATQLPLVQK